MLLKWLTTATPLFAAKSSLTLHQKEKHNDWYNEKAQIEIAKKNFPCNHCHKRYSTRQSLSTHQTAYHKYKKKLHFEGNIYCFILYLVEKRKGRPIVGAVTNTTPKMIKTAKHAITDKLTSVSTCLGGAECPLSADLERSKNKKASLQLQLKEERERHANEIMTK